MKKNNPWLWAVAFCGMSLLCVPWPAYGQLGSTESAYVQEAEESLFNFQRLDLNGAIEQALRKNYDQNIRGYQDKVLEIDWRDTKEEFWLPNLQLTLQSTNRVGRLVDGSLDNGQTSSSPTGSFGFSLGDYTVFNWGKDYLQYLNEKETYKRTKKVLSEQKRELKQNVIINFFELAFTRAIQKIKRNQLRHASFVYRLNREKISVKKIGRQGYFQARADFLRAQNEYQDAKVAVEVADEAMALLINDPIGTRYVLDTELRYEKIKISETESRKISTNNNPNLLNTKANLNNVKRNYDLALRENLPLPKFSVNLGAYNHNFAQNQNRTFFQTGTDNSNVELTATINATWSLVGRGGLLNQRITKRALYNRHLAYEQVAQAKHQVGTSIGQRFRRINNFQTQMDILSARIPNLQRTFDTILENYLEKKARYNDFHLALEELTETEALHEQVKFFHLREKVLLAQDIGVEDFPGENFELLAKPIRDSDPQKGGQ